MHAAEVEMRHKERNGVAMIGQLLRVPKREPGKTGIPPEASAFGCAPSVLKH